MGVDDALLALLAERTAATGLAYAEPPRRLGGGFYTENLAFRLAGAPADWDGPLILRLFPRSAPPQLATREAVVQNTLVAAGFPTPRALLWDEHTAPFGRTFLLMELLPGRALMGEPGLSQFLRSSAPLLVRLPRLLAETQARLHRVDPTPVVDALGERAAGVDRWLDFLAGVVEGPAPELAEGLQWLVANRPVPAGALVLNHGDLWPGNMLGQRRRVSAVLDWTLATVAEPALDVGFTTMALDIAPMDLPRRMVPLALWGSAKVSRRYVAAYLRLTGADLTNRSWYEALRCVTELLLAIEYRKAKLQGRTVDFPRPTWDLATDRMVVYFRDRTGVTLPLPPPV